MAFEPTKKQEKAINANENMLVSAAAGSGKTAVLVERITRLLTMDKPVMANRVLIVTFTNSAAAELRSRIEKSLNSRLKEKPDDRNLQEQLILLNNAKISTIDTFCMNFVRDNFERAGIDPAFKIVNASDLKLIESTIMMRLLNEWFLSDDEDFKSLLAYISDKDDDSVLQEYIWKIYNYSRQMPYPNEWINRVVEKYEAFADGIDSEWLIKALELIKLKANEVARIMNNAISALALNADAYKAYYAKYNYRLEIAEKISNCCLNGDWDGVYNLLHNFKLPGGGSLKPEQKDVNFEYAESLKDMAEDILRNKQKAGSIVNIVYGDIAFLRKEIRESVPFIKKLAQLINIYASELENELKSRGFMTFSMVAQTALSLVSQYKNGKVVPSDDVKEFISDYDVVMVDEYQDTNDLQDCLFNILSDNQKNLFCVGDAKQSIYRFRGANPRNFINKKKLYKEENEEDRLGLRVDLAGNFRSRHEICYFVNRVLSFIMHEDVADIEYDEKEQLDPLAKFHESDIKEVENHYIDLAAVARSGSFGETDNVNKKIYAEANVIAKIIKDTINAKHIIKTKESAEHPDGLKEIDYGDITILTKSPKRVADAYAAVLRAHGIPVSVPETGIFNSDEVQSIISLFKIIENPFDDISLLAALTSVIFGFTIDEIAEIRGKNNKCKLISALSLEAKSGNSKAKFFIDELSDLRERNIVLKIYELIDLIFEKTNYQGIISRQEDGELKKNNLSNLRNLAFSFEADGKKSLKEFLRVMDQVEDNDVKKNLPYCGNSVRIGSIHSSKGLQFPVCIVADCDKKFRFDDSTNALLMDEYYGFSLKHYSDVNNTSNDTLIRTLMSQFSRDQILAEEVRLLYVALTRAEEKLITVTCFDDFKKNIESLKDMSFVDNGRMRPYYFKNTTRYSDWLFAEDFCHDSKPFLDYLTTDEANEFIHTSFEEATVMAAETNKPDEKTVNILKANYAKDYPFAELLYVEAKASVTDIVHKSDELKYQFTSRPDFMNDGGMSAAGRGTSTHKFMQFCDYEAAVLSVKNECDRLYEAGYLTLDEANAVNISAVESFFSSSLYTRIKNAQSVKKEMNFLSEFPARFVHNELSAQYDDEMIIVQGAVDLLFIEEDEIVIVDFKTDRNKDESELIAAYAEQLKIYGMAAEALLGKKLRELIIYSFSLGKEIVI